MSSCADLSYAQLSSLAAAIPLAPASSVKLPASLSIRSAASAIAV